MSPSPFPKAPGFTLPDVRGEQNIQLSKALEAGRALVLFYRGGWCPLCSTQLASLTLKYQSFEQRNVQLLAISNNQVDDGLALVKRYGPPYPLLFDKDSRVIQAYNAKINRRDLLGFIKRKHDYARPALFLIEQNQRISWRYVGKNASDRPSVEEIIAAIDSHPKSQPIYSLDAAVTDGRSLSEP